MAIGTTFQLDLLYQIPGKQGAMTWHFNQLTAGPGAAVQDAQYCFDEVASDLATIVVNALPTQLSFVGAYVRQATVAAPTTYPYLGMFALPIAGVLGPGEVLPEGQGALCLIGPDTFSVSPRRQVNRKYFPLMLESDQTDGAIRSGYVSNLEGVFGLIFDVTSFDSNFQCVTYSAAEDALLSTAAWPAENVRVSDQIARLVRRRPKYQGRS